MRTFYIVCTVTTYSLTFLVCFSCRAMSVILLEFQAKLTAEIMPRRATFNGKYPSIYIFFKDPPPSDCFHLLTYDIGAVERKPYLYTYVIIKLPTDY